MEEDHFHFEFVAVSPPPPPVGTDSAAATSGDMYSHGSFNPLAAPGAEQQQQQGHAEDATSARSEVFPVYGNTSEFNINKLLYNNIMQCDYFKGTINIIYLFIVSSWKSNLVKFFPTALYQLRTYHETIG